MNFDAKAVEIVRDYIENHLDKSDPMPDFQVFTVWKCKTLQNWKYLLSSTLFDGMYYEVTYNGDKHEWYLDAYWLRGLIKRIANKTLKKKYGIDLNLDIRDLEISSNVIDKTVTLSTSIDISIPTSDINKIISQMEDKNND